MAESVSFWLENKNATGIVAASMNGQQLVVYRDRYYLVYAGAAVMKGGKPLRYSRSSLPGPWKKVLAGAETAAHSTAPDAPAKLRCPRKTPEKHSKEAYAMTESIEEYKAAPPATPKPARTPRKHDTKSTSQAAVAADCPYCGQKHEIPVEKGRSGKPFFLACSKCKNEFAVRFVLVTLYQSQVAGFR